VKKRIDVIRCKLFFNLNIVFFSQLIKSYRSYELNLFLIILNTLYFFKKLFFDIIGIFIHLLDVIFNLYNNVMTLQ